MLDLEKINRLHHHVRKEFMKTLVQYDQKKNVDKIQNDFMSFFKHVSPEIIEGKHHTNIADKFNKLANGEIKRLIIKMPPRHTIS